MPHGKEVDMEALIIDNSPKNVTLIEDSLVNSGFFKPCIFHHASIIDEAKGHIIDQHFRFIVIDPGFAEEYGLPLIKTIKDYAPSTKTIAFSLCSTQPCIPECGQRCLELGAACHLDKAKSFDLLPTIVRQCLNPVLGESETYIKVTPRKALHSILGNTFNNQARLKTPHFLRRNRYGKS